MTAVVSLPCPPLRAFVGVDQTGAVLQRGRAARPLPAALARQQRDGSWHLHAVDVDGVPLQLPSLTPDALHILLRRCRAPAVLDGTGLMLDCVIGLPGQHLRGGADAVWECMRGCTHGDVDGIRFGLARAQRFFDSLRRTDAFPRRECEHLAGATSVFTTRPYQKNVQTGTYRMWRDMVEAAPTRWVNLWPFDTGATAIPGAPWVFEAFPSLLWQRVLGARTRDRTRLPALLRAAARERGIPLRVHGLRAAAANADLADALVLAAGGVFLQASGTLFTPWAGFADHGCRDGEGWIAGLASQAVSRSAGSKAQAGSGKVRTRRSGVASHVEGE